MRLCKWILLIEDILKELPSYKLYEDFNKDIEPKEKSEYEKYCNKISDYNVDFPWLSDFCVKFAKNLTNVDITKGANSKHRCLQLNYWIYEEILKNHKNKRDNVYDMKFFRKIYEIGKEINNKKRDNYYCCSYFYGVLDEWKKEKYLHDYFINYEEINKKISSSNYKCNEYYNYLIYINKIYKEHKDNCCTFGDIYCHGYFDCDNNKNPSNLISKLKFHNQEIQEDGLDSKNKEEYENPTLENHMIDNYGKCIETYDVKAKKLGYKCVFPEDQKLEQEGAKVDNNNGTVNLGYHISAVDLSTYKKLLQTKFNSDKNEGNNVFHKILPKNLLTIFVDIRTKVQNFYFHIKALPCLYEKSKESEICKKLEEKREHEFLEEIIKSNGLSSNVITASLKMRELPGVKCETSVGYNDQLNCVESGNDVMKSTLLRVRGVTVLILGATVLLFLYYKFTPFGSWLNRKVLKKKNQNYKFQEGFECELIKNSSQGDRMYSNKKRIPIAYHQLHNM
ncbi:variable surface protein [Plasmodium gonderi]|uniref:Variable surface protein n=1 Tax=Plasmodium gonderi TaxID=77519 RepID=A0A1Y1JCJ8_PLAGO|nr:variable surface protein [Plasmodium gonderi]GAW79398.1 variable surface protein [Plasmodium gonderi]